MLSNNAGAATNGETSDLRPSVLWHGVTVLDSAAIARTQNRPPFWDCVTLATAGTTLEIMSDNRICP
jgi:hypothetical protein